MRSRGSATRLWREGRGREGTEELVRSRCGAGAEHPPRSPGGEAAALPRWMRPPRVSGAGGRAGRGWGWWWWLGGRQSSAPRGTWWPQPLPRLPGAGWVPPLSAEPGRLGRSRLRHRDGGSRAAPLPGLGGCSSARLYPRPVINPVR